MEMDEDPPMRRLTPQEEEIARNILQNRIANMNLTPNQQASLVEFLNNVLNSPSNSVSNSDILGSLKVTMIFAITQVFAWVT
jgi:hypothetical protein